MIRERKLRITRERRTATLEIPVSYIAGKGVSSQRGGSGGCGGRADKRVLWGRFRSFLTHATSIVRFNS